MARRCARTAGRRRAPPNRRQRRAWRNCVARRKQPWVSSCRTGGDRREYTARAAAPPGPEYHDRMPRATPHEVVSVDGHDVAISNPGKVLFPEAGLHQARPGALLPGGGRGRAARRRRTAERPGALPATASAASSSTRSARPASRPALDRRRRAAVPVRPQRRGSRAARSPRRSRGWPTSPASSCIRTRCAPTISIIPTSCASISIRCPASSGRSFVTWRAVVRATLERLRPHRLAEDLGLARHPRLRAHRAALDVRRGAARRARARARGRTARAGARHEQVVEGRTPRRVPRLQPEREGPHRRRRLLGAADARCARLGAAHLGRARRVRPRRLHAGDDAGTRSPRLAIRTPASTTQRARSTRCSSCRHATRSEGLGDAPWPPHYKKQAGEPPRVQPSKRRSPTGRRMPTRPLIEIGRARSKRTRWPGSSAGRPGIRTRPRTSSPRTCSSTRCAVAVQHVDADPRQPAARAGGAAAAAGAARSRRRADGLGPVTGAGGAAAPKTFASS